MIAVIVANTVVLAMAYPGMPQQYADDLNMANIIFTFIFLAEMIIKVCLVVFFLLFLTVGDL